MMDLHCHLDLYPNPSALVREIRSRGTVTFSVTTTPSAYRQTKALACGVDHIYTGIGLHPQIAGQRQGEMGSFEDYVRVADFVGEIGLDGGPEFKSTWPAQNAIFEKALSLADSCGGKVLSIHSRRAAAPVLAVLRRLLGRNSAILHWFSGTPMQLDEAIELGCWFSVGPAMLAGKKGRDLVARMPVDRILLETDGPFARIDDEPYYPWQAEQICTPVLASIFDMNAASVARVYKDNLHSLLVELRKQKPRAP